MHADGHDPMKTTPRQSGQSFQAIPNEALDPSQSQRTFLAHLRHQLRTPINAMLGYSEMLLEAAADQGQKEFVPDLQRIHAASNQLLARVNDIFDPAEFE